MTWFDRDFRIGALWISAFVLTVVVAVVGPFGVLWIATDLLADRPPRWYEAAPGLALSLWWVFRKRPPSAKEIAWERTLVGSREELDNDATHDGA